MLITGTIRNSTIIALGIFGTFAASAQDKAADRGDTSGTPPSSAQSLQRLVEKADQLASQSKQTAWKIYKLALVYSPEDARITQKQKSLGVSESSTTDLEGDEIVHCAKVVQTLDTRKILKDLPAPEAKTHSVELRLLNDSTLVGDVRYSTYDSDLGAFSVFTAAPAATLPTVTLKYGAPGNTARDDAHLYASYGHVVIVAGKDGKVTAVCFRW
jgi:hypothetical protein